MADVENTNEYDEARWEKASVSADSEIVEMWEAGASLDDIVQMVANALANAGVPQGTVVTVQVG